MSMQFEPGAYLGRITGQGYSKSKGGVDQFCINFEVDGKPRTVYITLKTDQNAKYFVADMKRLGCPMTSFGMLDSTQDGYHDLTGLETTFICEENEYPPGTIKERWKLGRDAAVESDSTVAGSLEQKFGCELEVVKEDANRELLQEASKYEGTDDSPF